MSAHAGGSRSVTISWDPTAEIIAAFAAVHYEGGLPAIQESGAPGTSRAPVWH